MIESIEATSAGRAVGVVGVGVACGTGAGGVGFGSWAKVAVYVEPEMITTAKTEIRQLFEDRDVDCTMVSLFRKFEASDRD